MAVAINPIPLQGEWESGYALDLHTLSSTLLGYDSFGHEVFETQRSPIGELLYRLKYRQDPTALNSIADTVVRFLTRWNIPIDAIVPVPPTNKARRVQPVLEVARAVSGLAAIPLCDSVKKVKETDQLKNLFDFEGRTAALKDAFVVEYGATEGRRALLFDDLFRSGATATAVTRALVSGGRAASVYLLTLTKTRRRS